MNKKSILCIAVSAAFLAGSLVPASAADPAADVTTVAAKRALQIQLFNEADVNHDGKVTAQEFSDFVLTLVFNTYDTNNSGKLSRTEYVALVKGPETATTSAEWKIMDPNGLGYITLADYLKDSIAVNQMKNDFRKLDKSGKGYITMKDLPALKN
jgi:Ca2+-binding EF-hand superfamily protein